MLVANKQMKNKQTNNSAKPLVKRKSKPVRAGEMAQMVGTTALEPGVGMHPIPALAGGETED